MNDLIKAAKLWARVSAKTGATYYVGRMGGCRVLVLENRDRKGADEPSHFLFLGDAEAGQEQPQDGPANRSARQQRPEAVAQRAPGRHQERGDGYRGPSAYRRPANGRPGPPVADEGPFHDDDLGDIGRGRG
jgi:hypothetical protein